MPSSAFLFGAGAGMHLQGLDRNLILEAHGRRDRLVQREGRRSKDAQEVQELERPIGVHRCVPI
jgi:hypothetical protein